jgi:hypothetical protein
VQNKSEKSKQVKDQNHAGNPTVAEPVLPCDQSPPSSHPKGGLTTISPPAKISCDDSGDFKVLASGVDTLVLAIDITWNEPNIFLYLEELKEKAKASNEDCAGIINIPGAGEWPFLVKPYGTNGYEWLITGNGFTLSVGNWLKPISRPSVIAEIRSQALWELSPPGTITVLRALLESAGARLILMKPSRVDLCVDLLMPEEAWMPDLMSYRVTRANAAATY